MKKVFAISILMLVCLLLPTVCFAQTQEEWNLSCNLKTSCSTTVYKTEAKHEIKETIPANTYVKIHGGGADGFCVINYMINGQKRTGLVMRSNLIRCTSTVRGSSGYADSVHELDPNHDAILASKPVINVADSLLQQGDKDYSDLTFENPDSSSASAAQQTAGRGNKVEEDKIIELSKPILSYDEFVSGAHWMQDPWDESKPYFWWGASDVQTNVDIYLCIEQKNDQEWYVAYGFIADQGGNIKYSFSLEDDKSITITQDTVYPSIRWKTDVSFRLDDFDTAAVEAVCMDAIAFLEKLREHPCFMEYRIEE